MDRILPGDVRRHGSDLYAVLTVCKDGPYQGRAHIVPLTTNHANGVHRIDDRYSLLAFAAELESVIELGKHTTWTAEIDLQARESIVACLAEHTRTITESDAG